jgi:hypothetical protein
MYSPAFEQSLLQILNEDKDALLAHHPFIYPQSEPHDRDSMVRTVVDLHNLLNAHRNKFAARFRALNIAHDLELRPLLNSLSRILRTAGAIADDAWESSHALRITGFNLVFNFKEGSRYLFKDKFYNKGLLGIFIGITSESADGEHPTLFEQIFYASKAAAPLILPEKPVPPLVRLIKDENVQLV